MWVQGLSLHFEVCVEETGKTGTSAVVCLFWIWFLILQLYVKMAKEKLKARKKKSGGLRPEEKSKGVEEKKTVKNMVMDTGLCCNFCVVCSGFSCP